jgi:ATP-dependent Lon protease
VEYYRVQVRAIHEGREGRSAGSQVAALMRSVLAEFSRYNEVQKKIPREVTAGIEKVTNPDRLVNLIAANAPFKLEKKVVEELPREVARSIRFLYVQTIQEALAALFPPELLSAAPPAS